MAAMGDHGHLQPVVIDLAIFLGDYAVRSRRQWRAGEDAHGLSRLQFDLGGLAGSDVAGDLQPRTRRAHVGASQGVAVHRAVVPERQVEG
jgi:hypothetical protein